MTDRAQPPAVTGRTAPRITNPSQPAATLPVWSTGVSELELVSSVVASSDKVVVANGQAGKTDVDGRLYVFDAKTGQKLREDHGFWVHSLALSPDGVWLATSEHPDDSGEGAPGDADRVRILNLDTGAERCRLTADVPPDTAALTFSPDGRWVAAVGRFQTALVFDAASGAQRWRTAVEGASSVAWSPGSDSVAIGCSNGVSIRFANDGSQRVPAPSSSVFGAVVVYSRDGGRIVAGCTGTIRVFDASSGVQSWSAQVSASDVESVAISDDQRWVTGISDDKVVGVYDLIRGTPRYPPVTCSTSGRVLFSPTLRHIIAGDGDLIDARTGHVINTYARVSCFIPPDGGAIAAAGRFVMERYDLGVLISERDLGTNLALIAMSAASTPLVAVTDTTPGAAASVTVIDATNGNRLANKPVPGQINGVAFADANQAVVTASPTGVRLFSVVGDRSWILDTTTIGEVKALASAGPTGEMIAIAAGKTAQMLSSADGQSRWTHTHPQTVTRIAASRDGNWIATGCADRITRILDAQSGTEIFTSVAGGGAVSEIAFQSNTSLLGSSNLDTQVLLINAANPTERGQLTRHFPCRHIAFSSDTTMLAVADDNNTVAIYDITTISSPQQLQELGFAAPITALAFNPADNSIAAAIGAKSVVVYDPRSGIELTRILHPQPVRQFSFSADGALIATASDDGIVRVWAS